MKKKLLAAVLCAFAIATFPLSASARAEHSIKAYNTKKGRHVDASHATNPNRTRKDNFTHLGNVNPHTGKVGTKR
jgi:Ni/Co efflux regulator RcnB